MSYMHCNACGCFIPRGKTRCPKACKMRTLLWIDGHLINMYATKAQLRNAMWHMRQRLRKARESKN